MRYLIIIFLFFISISTLFGQLTPVKMGNWKHEGVLANGTWTISADSLSVRQSENDEPTFFVSPDTFLNVTIRGSFYVNASDDDYIGFVFGYLRPDGPEEYFDFYLLDWKGRTQAGAEEGFTLSKVLGYVNVGSGTNTSHPYWNHNDTTQIVLGTYYGDYGWARDIVYDFELIYESNRVRITIDSTLIIDVEDDFRPGRFGFYNYSQPGVNYQEFRLNEAPVAVDDYFVTPNDSTLAMNLTQNDRDGDGHNIIITRVGEAAHGVIDYAQGDSLVYYTPHTNFFGTDSFYYHISDDNGGVDSAMVVVEVLDLTALEDLNIPIKFGLYQNYPNPFNPSTMISYQLPMSNAVELSVYNLLGQKVVTLVNEKQPAGSYKVEWDARSMPSGVYYYRINAGEFSEVKKMILIR